MTVNEYNNLLGLKCKDKVTGFKGVITSISFDLYGCVQAVVNPEISEDGNRQDSAWYDVNRLTITSKTPVMQRPDFDYCLVKGPEIKSILKP